MQQPLFIGRTKDGSKVYVDMETSHAATHFADTPQLLELVREVLPTLELDNDSKRFELDMGRIVGESDCVETGTEDNIIYAKRLSRDTYSRFVRGKHTIQTSWLTISLERIDKDTCELVTAYIGRSAPPFPGNEFETPESRPFWEEHALVWGEQQIVPGTETKDRPW